MEHYSFLILNLWESKIYPAKCSNFTLLSAHLWQSAREGPLSKRSGIIQTVFMTRSCQAQVQLLKILIEAWRCGWGREGLVCWGLSGFWVLSSWSWSQVHWTEISVAAQCPPSPELSPAQTSVRVNQTATATVNFTAFNNCHRPVWPGRVSPLCPWI